MDVLVTFKDWRQGFVLKIDRNIPLGNGRQILPANLLWGLTDYLTGTGPVLIGDRRRAMRD